MLRIGPSGNSIEFYESGHKHTYEAPAWLSEMGLTAYEYSFGRGVHITDDTAEKIREQMAKFDIAVSVHAPYYTNFANPDPEMIEKSIGYLLQSAAAVKKMGGNRVVFHPAACGKMRREDAVELTKQNLKLLSERLGVRNDVIFCAETMGKINQIGTVEEVVEFCKIDPRFYPCYDFGHINSYTRGGIKGKEDYRRIIDYTFSELGEQKAKNIHIHFSKIQYGQSGEIRHLTLADTEYGPEYEPLAEIIDEYRMTPVIICESKEVMASDALIMKNCHKIV